MKSSFDQVRNLAKSIAEVSTLLTSKEYAKKTESDKPKSEELSNRDMALIALGVTPKRLRSAGLESALSAF